MLIWLLFQEGGCIVSEGSLGCDVFGTEGTINIDDIPNVVVTLDEEFPSFTDASSFAS